MHGPTTGSTGIKQNKGVQAQNLCKMLRSIPRVALRLQPSVGQAAVNSAWRVPAYLAQTRSFGACKLALFQFECFNSRIPECHFNLACFFADATASVNSYRFAKSHEWAKLDGDIATIGISVHAQKELGDIVFVELPEKGDKLEAGKTIAAVESVKAAADVYTPVAGEVWSVIIVLNQFVSSLTSIRQVVDVNASLTEDPAIVNKSAETDGWIAKVFYALCGNSH